MTLTTPPDSQTDDLSVLMREGSQAEHTEAETSNFMSSLLKGEVNERGYALYLAMLRPIYAALESVARQLADDPLAAPFIDADLERLASIDADIAYWAPEGVPSFVSPAVDAYVAAIEDSARWGGTFVAHHYTRYLGDLSGGQAIGRILGRSWGIEDKQGLAFYDFSAIPKPKPYKDAYRAKLDALPLTPEEKQLVVIEVKSVFAHNSALFAELTAQLDDFRR